MLQDKDFKKMRIPPLKDGDDYEENFRHLEGMKTFNQFPTHKRKIVNYILLMYDPQSPFVKKYQNVNSRKTAICDYTGLSKVKESTRNQITGYNNEEILIMIDEYVKFVKSRLWSMIVTSESAFYEFQSQVLTIATGKDSKDKLGALKLKTDILKSLDEIASRLDGYYETLYSSDKDLEDIIKTIAISPEGIASGEQYAN